MLRCWSPVEILETGEYSETSDVFSAGLVLHHILAEKKHAFGPEDERGMSEAGIQHETEVSITKGQLNLSETISPEACHLLKQMLQKSKDDRPTAASCLNHPFFWSKKEKKDFLCAVGNQPEIQRPRHIASSCGLSSVETDLEVAFASEFSSNPWDTQIPQIYMEMTCMPRSRRYITSSAVDLVRFVRNSYAHFSEPTRSSFFQKNLLDEYMYFDTFPTLVITVYDIVMKYAWNGREEIRHAHS